MVRTAVTEVAAWWVVMVALTVVLISSVGPVELAVAAVAGLGAAFAARRIRRAVRLGRPRGRGAPRALAVLPWSLVRGAAVLARDTCAGGRRSGAVRRVVLRPGTGAGWAGLLLAASADTCVLGTGEGGDGESAENGGNGDGPAPGVRVHALRPEPGAMERAFGGPGGPGGLGGPR
ncbi:hypothetical protein [Streptomyces sp. NPDC087270]|uniref:hypothetical protein n=1 Tax=Streptomyces sp. NPDC087270 TaxID=3365774 RepID=UPI0037FAE424